MLPLIPLIPQGTRKFVNIQFLLTVQCRNKSGFSFETNVFNLSFQTFKMSAKVSQFIVISQISPLSNKPPPPLSARNVLTPSKSMYCFKDRQELFQSYSVGHRLPV